MLSAMSSMSSRSSRVQFEEDNDDDDNSSISIVLDELDNDNLNLNHDFLEEELSQLQEKTRSALKTSWNRVEKLQQEGVETSEKLAELEQHVQLLKNNNGVKSDKRSSFKRNSEPPGGSSRNLNYNHNDENDEDNTSFNMHGSGRLQDSFSMMQSGTTNMDDSFVASISSFARTGRKQKRRSTCHGRVELSANAAPHLQSYAKIMEQEKEESLRELTEEFRRKQNAMETLQRTTVIQQDTCQQLQQELDALQLNTPDGLAKLHHGVKEKEAFVEKLEEDVRIAEKTLSERHLQHQELEAELLALEDLAASTETEEAAKLEEVRLEFLTTEAETKRQEELQMKFDARIGETLEKVRQHLMEFLPHQFCQTTMTSLTKRFEKLRQLEEQLSLVLVERMKEEEHLEDCVERLSRSKESASKSLANLSDLLKKYPQVQDLVDENNREGINFLGDLEKLSDLQVRVCEILSKVQDELSHRINVINGKSRGRRNKEFSMKDAAQMELKVRAMQLNSSQRARRRLSNNSRVSEVENDQINDDLEEKDAGIESLKAKTEEQGQTMESLKTELKDIRTKSREESEAALNLLESLQQDLRSIVDGLNEKDHMVTTLTELLKVRKSNEEALMVELHALRNDEH